MVQVSISAFILALTLVLAPSISAQESIDGSFSIQETEKTYSIYVPSGYTPGTLHPVMLGLHPWNTRRWDAKSWRDTLIVFAEENNLLLVCPNGGPDGQVDDMIDTTFTTALLDSVETWYSVNSNRMYAMGFSWGGRTVYTYGLANFERFGGYMPIGAAVDGPQTFADVVANAANKPVYIVHGSFDNQANRYDGPKASLEANNAIVNTMLMDGVGHTIDFPNRNSILGNAYRWIDSVNTANITTNVEEDDAVNSGILVYPNPARDEIRIDGMGQGARYRLIGLTGNVGKTGTTDGVIDVSGEARGLYVLSVENRGKKLTRKIFLQ